MQKPTDAELEILQVLWQEGPSTVRQVNDILGRRRDIGYTTSLKLMQIMHEKGLVTRIEDGRTHIYAAAVAERDTQSYLLQEFVDQTFRGSAMNLVMQALGNHQEVSAEEIEAIKSLIAKMEQEQNNRPS
ncbi:MAG: BlaI/MecI/CopY family transcriptional regulator [Lewinellaceae bacterium]|nr:BlaI/MecI/CopY family transcriptional regulator [Lewinellaceae bacterium]